MRKIKIKTPKRLKVNKDAHIRAFRSQIEFYAFLNDEYDQYCKAQTWERIMATLKGAIL